MQGVRHASEIQPRYARLFSIGADSVLWVSPVGNANTPRALIRQGSLNNRSRVICLSGVLAALLDELNLANTVVGVDETAYISSPTLAKGIAEGKIRSVKRGGQLDVESVLSLKPDALFYYQGAGGEDPSFKILRGRGILLIPINNYMEEHPLGRAEWVRFAGRIFGVPNKADSLFAGIVDAYEQIRTRIGDRKDRPRVFCNAPFQGVWDQPRAGNYLATLIRDAGGEYLWADAPGSGTMSLQPEAVLLKAKYANVWINCNDYTEKHQLALEDPRLAQFLAFRNNRVYAPNARRQQGGANPYWEQGVVRPDLVLNDLQQIFSDTAANGNLYFYRKLR